MSLLLVFSGIVQFAVVVLHVLKQGVPGLELVLQDLDVVVVEANQQVAHDLTVEGHADSVLIDSDGATVVFEFWDLTSQDLKL